MTESRQFCFTWNSWGKAEVDVSRGTLFPTANYSAQYLRTRMFHVKQKGRGQAGLSVSRGTKSVSFQEGIVPGLQDQDADNDEE